VKPLKPWQFTAVSLVALGGLVGLGGCSDGDTGTGPGAAGEVELALAGMPPGAQSEAVFELWISFALTEPAAGPHARHSAAASAGRFKIHDQTGEIVGMDYQPLAFDVNPLDENVPVDGSGNVLWQLAVDAFITLEPREDADPEPRLNGLIGGSFLNGTAQLSTDSGDALSSDFSTASGSAQLATPTTADSGDEDEGVWFALAGGTGPSLSLPPLPAGWTYEGWVSVPQIGARSLGKFTSVTGADADGAGPLAVSQPWAFPGSDFPFGVTDASLQGGSVVVTLEPPLDEDGAGPFFLEILGGAIPVNQPVNVPFPLGNASTFPTGTVTIPTGS